MQILLSGQQMQAADLYTQERIGVPSLVLMERAALAVADRVCAMVPAPESGRPPRVAIVAGKGNNGADALAVVRILTDRQLACDVYVMDAAPETGSQAAIQQGILRQYGIGMQDLAGSLDRLRDTVYDAYVDGLFGIGLSREITGTCADVIAALNAGAAAHHAAVIAIDIPSGVDATDGHICGVAVQAHETVTFGFAKRGQWLYPGCDYCGHLTVADIGIPAWSHEGAAWYTYDTERAEDLLPERRPDGNKGTFGKGLLVAGSYAMAGAATMAASAAGRMGCGMVKIYTRAENRVIIQETVPEALLSVWTPDAMDAALLQLEADLSWADTVAIGPALGKGDAEWTLLRTVLEMAGTRVHHLILDADAIRLLAERDGYALLAQAGACCDVILTPHLAECAALLQTTVEALQTDREGQLRTFARAYHVTLLCKDARSMAVTGDPSEERTYLNTSGNDGLATAGSGDVLTGMLTACTAQGLSGLDAAAAAAYLHGRLAERAENTTGRRGLVATDLYQQLNSDRTGRASVVWAADFS